MAIKESNVRPLLIVIGVFIAGIVIGIVIQMVLQANDKKIQQAIKIQPTLNALTSKTIQSIVEFGKVVSIDGRKVTINYSGDQTVVDVAPNAQIFIEPSTQDPKTGNLITGAPQPVDFSSIKVGDNVTINLGILDTGLMEGSSVYIFASPS